MNIPQVCRSIALAGHTGDVPTVEAGLGHPDPAVRVVALGAAIRLGLLDPDRLADFLSDAATGVRYRALEILPGVPGAERLVPTVIALLDDPELAEVAAFTLGEVPLSERDRHGVVEALSIQATEHEDALCRESAVAALGAIEGGLPAILRACDDVATVRRRAVIALAPFQGPEVTAALKAALTDRDWQVRQAAEDLLALEHGADDER